MIQASATVGNLPEFIDALRGMGLRGRPPVWFRGHQLTSYTLMPSVYRPPSPMAPYEVAMLKRFKQDAESMEPAAVRTDWDLLFLAQHNGVPTRLLDWSENALIALYFACEGARTGANPDRPNADVWVLLPYTLNSSAAWVGDHEYDLPMLGVDDFLDRYSPLNRSDAREVLQPAAVLAGRRFGRILNQRGTFTVGHTTVPLEAYANASEYLFRIEIAGGGIDDMFDDLRYLGIEERVVYPELHRLGARTKEMFS